MTLALASQNAYYAPMTIREFIQMCGGPSKVADFTGTAISTVSTWSARGAIPSRYWRDFVDNGQDIELIWELHQITKPKQAAE